MATDAVRKGDDREAFAINLTPMIDVVFQLIIFFMCAMKFKTLEKKIEAYLPKDRGLAKTPEKIEEKVQIKVILRQKPEEGVPQIEMFGQMIRPELGPGVGRLPPLPKNPQRTDREADEARRAQHMARYITPKLTEVQEKIEKYLREDPTLPCQIDAGPQVEHAYVIGVLDTFLKACNTLGKQDPEITFVGTPPPRPGE